MCIFKKKVTKDETIYDFTTRHFGSFVRDNLFRPIVHGIYSGDIEDLSIKYTFPVLYKYSCKYNSILIGFLIENLNVRSFCNGFYHLFKSTNKFQIYNLEHGMQSLITKLYLNCENNIVLNSSVLKIQNEKDNIKVYSSNKIYNCKKLIFAININEIGNILNIRFPYINYYNIYVAHVFYNKKYKNNIPEGYGYLKSTIDNSAILGVLFNNNKYLTILLRKYYTNIPVIKLNIIDILKTDLDINIVESDIYIKLNNCAIPQYNLNYSDTLKNINDTLKQNDYINKFYYLGDWKGKIGINNRITDSINLYNNKNKTKTIYVLANFGGPRNLSDIYCFLRDLLTDQDVIRSGLPKSVHRCLFSTIAFIRSFSKKKEYDLIGGKSPIHEKTEQLAGKLRTILDIELITFHRYNTENHTELFNKLNKDKLIKNIKIFTLFPQFSYSTVGSISRIFNDNLNNYLKDNTQIIRSYYNNDYYINAFSNIIIDYIKTIKRTASENIFLLFSAHGLPQEFIDNGDTYKYECEYSYNEIMKRLDYSDIQNGMLNSILCYQSRFGFSEWIKPYTINVCENINKYINTNDKIIIFIPIAFTMDHLETLYEIENEYMPVIKESGLNVYRCPTLGLDNKWIYNIENIINDETLYKNLDECIYKN